MEPEGWLPCSQEPSTGPYSEPDQSNPYHPNSFITHIIIKFLSHFLCIYSGILELLNILNKLRYNQIIKIFKSTYMLIMLLYIHYLCFYLRTILVCCHLLC
jgi:hypothetical protein